MLPLVFAACTADPKPHRPTVPDSPTPTPVVDSATHDSATTPIPAASGLAWTLNPDVGSVVSTTWEQDVAGTVHVEYSFDPDQWASTPEFDAEPGPQQQVLVGIPFGSTATWRVVTDGEAIDGPELTTADVPSGLPLPRVEVSDPTRYYPDGKYLLTSMNALPGGFVGGRYWTVILDRQGRLVWAKQAPPPTWTLFPQVSSTGTYLLWDENTAWISFDGGAKSRVHETWLDEEIAVIDTPGVQHPLVQLPDETLAWGSGVHGPTEALVEKAPGQADETVVWSCADDWAGEYGKSCSSNGLFYDPPTDSYLYSFWTNSTVVAVARNGDTTGPTPGSTLWWAGGAPDSYGFDPVQDQFFWQHGVSYTADRTLLVSSTSGFGFTWLREYEVDRDNQTLRYVWGSNSGVRADNNGAAWRLPNGNSLHVVGTAGVVREVTDDDTDVWRLTWDGTHNLGEGQLLGDLYPLVKPREP